MPGGRGGRGTSRPGTWTCNRGRIWPGTTRPGAIRRVWIGRGAPELGIAGQQATGTQMRNLFGLGLHPANVRHLHHALSVHRLLAPVEGVPGAPERRHRP